MSMLERTLDMVCDSALNVCHTSYLSDIQEEIDGEEDILEKLLIIDDEMQCLRSELKSLRKLLKSTRKFHDSVHSTIASTEMASKMYKAIHHIENVIDTIVDEIATLNEWFEINRDGKLVAIKTEGWIFKRRVAYLMETS